MTLPGCGLRPLHPVNLVIGIIIIIIIYQYQYHHVIITLLTSQSASVSGCSIGLSLDQVRPPSTDLVLHSVRPSA